MCRGAFHAAATLSKRGFCGIDNPLRPNGKFRQAVAGSGSCPRAKCGGVRTENRASLAPSQMTAASWPRRASTIGNRALNQLSEGVLERVDSRSQSTPGSLEATGLHDPGRRIQTLGLDPRPPVEIPLQPLGANRPIRQPMRWQHRETQTAGLTQVTLDPLLDRLFGFGITPVAPVPVHHPRTPARTQRTLSSELIFSNLNRRAFAKSSTPIKPL